MTKLKELELKLKSFQEGVDYSFVSKPQEKIYCFFSEEVKKIVSPFPSEELENSVVVSCKKVEKDTVTGEYFIYEQSADGSEFDKLIIKNDDSEVNKRIKEIERSTDIVDYVDERIRQIDKIDERIKEIDAIPSGSGITHSFTVRKFNEKGEVIREDKKISSEPLSTAEIQEITDQEAQQIEKNNNKNKQLVRLKVAESSQISSLDNQKTNELVNQQKTRKIALISLLAICLVSIGYLLVIKIKNHGKRK